LSEEKMNSEKEGLIKNISNAAWGFEKLIPPGLLWNLERAPKLLSPRSPSHSPLPRAVSCFSGSIGYLAALFPRRIFALLLHFQVSFFTGDDST
jgi:hypothetical protein